MKICPFVVFLIFVHIFSFLTINDFDFRFSWHHQGMGRSYWPSINSNVDGPNGKTSGNNCLVAHYAWWFYCSIWWLKVIISLITYVIIYNITQSPSLPSNMIFHFLLYDTQGQNFLLEWTDRDTYRCLSNAYSRCFDCRNKWVAEYCLFIGRWSPYYAVPTYFHEYKLY